MSSLSKGATSVAESEDVRDYELMVILPPDITEVDLKAKIADIEEVLSQHGGKILHFELTVLREFAYRIRKHDRGYYATFHFSYPIEHVNELERFVRIESGAIRHLLVSCPAHYEFKGLMAYEQEAEALKLKETEERKAKEEDEQQKRAARTVRPARTEKPAQVPAASANVSEKSVPEKKASVSVTPDQKPEFAKVDEQLRAILDNPDIQL